MNAPVTLTPAQRLRGRLTLIGLFVLFFGTALTAGLLRFVGWQPEGSRNHGELLQPPGDLRALTPRLAAGGEYPWRGPEGKIWRIALAPPPDCGQACGDLLRDLDKVWRLFGHDADHVHLLWIGAPPPADVPHPPSLRVLQADDALLEALPRREDTAGAPVYVIDPNGFVILRYAPGFDLAGLRGDVAKLLKLL